MTEAEAQQKWCPFVRVVTGGEEGITAINRGPKTLDRTRCIASECMMWRWNFADDGHCGLAGPRGEG